MLAQAVSMTVAVGYVAWLTAGVLWRRRRAPFAAAAAWTTPALFASLYLNVACSAIECWMRGSSFSAVSLAGAGLIAVKVALTVWSVRALGRHYSYNVSAVAGHELVKSGPYAFCRHPMYSARMLATCGIAMCFGAPFSMTAFLAIDAAIVIARIRAEERLLRRVIGSAYDEYASRVGALVPGFRSFF